MDREELRQFVLSNYSAEPDRPWLTIPALRCSVTAITKSGLPW